MGGTKGFLVKTRVSAPLAAVFASLLVLTGCASAPSAEAPSAPAGDASLLSEFELDGLDAKQIIDRLDALPVAERPASLFASIRAESLVVTDGAAREVSLPMPADEFYVSIAPYATQTHDCYYHSLTTCLGELQDAELQVTITDADGTVLADGAYRTFSNGFIGFWLPRNIDATITIEHDGHTVTAPLSTSAEDPTCVTTLQLS